jgi:tripartite-type tricarboxylate transporter receptor subunit TctC
MEKENRMKALRLLLASAGLFCFSATPAFGQAYPTKLVRIVVPFTPGGGNDVYARTIAAKLQERFGQPVIVENKPGAGGNIGAEHVAKSAPDGHTLLVAQNGLTMNPWVTPNLPFDVEKDFAPVGISLTLPLGVVVNPASPIKSLPDLIAHAKAQPNSLSYAIPGIGTPQHLATELFLSMTGTKMVAVPYKGAAGMIADLMGGQIHVLFGALNSILPHMQSGKLRGIGVGNRERLPYLPEVPAIAEALPGYEAGFWFGLLAPAGTPEPILNKLSEEVRIVVTMPDVVQRLKAVGFDINPGTPAQMRAVIKADLEKWGKVVKEAGIKAQ